MRTYDEFKKTVYDALETSNITPEKIIENDTAITVSIHNDDDIHAYLKNLSNILEAERLRFKSSVSVPSHIQTISISIFNQ
jgi:hypothetical protein